MIAEKKEIRLEIIALLFRSFQDFSRVFIDFDEKKESVKDNTLSHINIRHSIDYRLGT